MQLAYLLFNRLTCTVQTAFARRMKSRICTARVDQHKFTISFSTENAQIALAAFRIAVIPVNFIKLLSSFMNNTKIVYSDWLRKKLKK